MMIHHIKSVIKYILMRGDQFKIAIRDIILLILIFIAMKAESIEVIVNPYDDQQEYYEYSQEIDNTVTVTCAEGHYDCYHQDNSLAFGENNEPEIVYNFPEENEQEYDSDGFIGNQSFIDPFLERIRREQEVDFILALKKSGYNTVEAIQFVEYLKSTGLMYGRDFD